MGSSSQLIIVSLTSLLAFASLLLVLPLVDGNGSGVICEEVPQELCAFSISSSGRRCVLERSIMSSKEEEESMSLYQYCSTSGVVVTNYMADWIETDECVSACGLDRNTLGISSDSLLEREKLCSTACSHGCPNILDLYSNLSSAQGVSLPEMCKAVQGSR